MRETGAPAALPYLAHNPRALSARLAARASVARLSSRLSNRIALDAVAAASLARRALARCNRRSLGTNRLPPRPS